MPDYAVWEIHPVMIDFRAVAKYARILGGQILAGRRFFFFLAHVCSVL